MDTKLAALSRYLSYAHTALTFLDKVVCFLQAALPESAVSVNGV